MRGRPKLDRPPAKPSYRTRAEVCRGLESYYSKRYWNLPVKAVWRERCDRAEYYIRIGEVDRILSAARARALLGGA